METKTCDNPKCKQVHLADTSIPNSVWNGHHEVTHYFCSTQCMHDDYIARLTGRLYE